MSRISYVNGQYVPHADAFISMEDRGYLFSDGIYEVIAFYNKTLLDGERHMKRLERSLKELDIKNPMSMRALKMVMQELIDRNHYVDGSIYMQVTRGTAKRDHIYPKHAKPGLSMMVTPPKMPKAREVLEGVKVITQPDIRWGRRDIKSVSLLPNVLAKQAAAESSAREAWLLTDEGMITEGAVSNNFIITAKNEIITHPKNYWILGGITRDVVVDIIRKHKFKIIERPFSFKEAQTAKEAFLTSTTSNILPVVMMNGKKLGDGKPGAITKQLLNYFYDHIEKQTGYSFNRVA
jgi:D-alanine transaminase